MMSTIAYWTMIAMALTSLGTLLVLVRRKEQGVWQPRPASEKLLVKEEKLSASRKGERHWLLGIDGEVVGRVFHLGLRTATIGRKETNHVQVCDLHASRVHCQLTPINKGVLLTDMKSQNGIVVNDKPTRSCVLKDGDIIQVCDARFLYRVEGNYGICEVPSDKMTGPQMHTPTLCQAQ